MNSSMVELSVEDCFEAKTMKWFLVFFFFVRLKINLVQQTFESSNNKLMTCSREYRPVPSLQASIVWLMEFSSRPVISLTCRMTSRRSRFVYREKTKNFIEYFTWKPTIERLFFLFSGTAAVSTVIIYERSLRKTKKMRYFWLKYLHMFHSFTREQWQMIGSTMLRKKILDLYRGKKAMRLLSAEIRLSKIKFDFCKFSILIWLVFSQR